MLLGDIRKDLLENRKAGGSKRVVLKIAEYIIHPGYKKPSSYNDIALVRLERKVTLSRAVLPACLPQPQYRLENKQNMTTLGWGLLGTGRKSTKANYTLAMKKMMTRRSMISGSDLQKEPRTFFRL